MAVTYEWRGSCTDAELNALHAEAFGTPAVADPQRDWNSILNRHSLGWVIAREDGSLVGFINVITDGMVHAWIQDTMVATVARQRGIGSQLVAVAKEQARVAGCLWLHVDYEADLSHFYQDSCGFGPTTAGLIDLTKLKFVAVRRDGY